MLQRSNHFFPPPLDNYVNCYVHMQEQDTRHHYRAAEQRAIRIVLIMCFKLKSIMCMLGGRDGCSPMERGKRCRSSGRKKWALKIPDIWGVAKWGDALHAAAEQPCLINATFQTQTGRGEWGLYPFRLSGWGWFMFCLLLFLWNARRSPGGTWKTNTCFQAS